MKISLNASASIPAHYMNRHCLITGPTGTGKTVSILRLIESLAKAGTPVIAPDVKGDLPPYADHVLSPGEGLFVPLWAMGADLIARALELTETQAGALEIAFAYADETAAPLDTLADMRALLANIAAAPNSVAHLGYVTRASVGTIQRAILRIDRQGQGGLFGAPALDIAAAMDSGRVTVIDASRLYHSPRLYGALMLWLLREIATRLPESGDLERPRLALVIDESHCLFHEASPALLRSIEATARLIRSKGVALVFASQSPGDLPAVIREQCATRIEHERALGVGNCRFSTLDSSGNATAPRVIRPDMASKREKPPIMPVTHIGGITEVSAGLFAHQPAPPSTPRQSEQPENMDWAGYVFLCISGAALLALGYWLGS